MVSGIAHVSFTVSDLEKSLYFYHDLLGFELRTVVERSGPDVEGITGFLELGLRLAI